MGYNHMPSSVFTQKYNFFRTLLYQARISFPLTQTEVAHILDKPQSFVSKYENGERRLDLLEFLDIAKALNIDPITIINKLQGKKMTILDEWEISAENISEILLSNPSLRGMLFGYVAELKLRDILNTIPGINYIIKPDDHDRKKKGDLSITYKGRVFRIEAKSLQSNSIEYDESENVWRGKSQVDASDKRCITLPNGEKLETTLLLYGEFDILAVNCYAFNNKWNFIFAKNKDLPSSTYPKYSVVQQQYLIASLVSVSLPPRAPFCTNLQALLDEMCENDMGAIPRQE